MNTETRYETFTQTRGTWLVLTMAVLLWVALCLWAVKQIGFFDNPDSPAAQQAENAGKGTDANADALQVKSETDAAEQAMLALEAEEEERLQAQAAAVEQRRLAAAEAEEEARLAAEAEAAEQARLAAEEEAAEQARLVAEEEAAEQARLAAEEEAAEQARLVAEAEAAEQARLAAEEEAAEQARLAAEAEDAEQARLDAEQKAEEQARLKAAEAADRNSAQNVVDERARQAAAAEASRVAAVARQLRQYESLRERELSVLDGLSNLIQFERGSATVSRDIERLLDDIFNPLYLYSDLPVLVSVSGNEYDGSTSDRLLSRDRGRAIASYLINRGLEKDRFRILIESGQSLAIGTHRVSVSAEEVSQ